MIIATKLRSNLIAPFLLSATFFSAILYHGENINVLNFTKALLVLLAIITLWNSPTQNIKLPKNNLVIVTALFWCYLISNIPFGNIPEQNNHTIWLLSLLPATFFLYQLTEIKQQQWNLLLNSIITITSWLALYYIFQLFSNKLPFSGAGAAFFPNRNILAALLNLVIFATSILFISATLKNRSIARIALGTSLFLMTYAMAMTQSRGGLIAFIIALTLFIFLSYKNIPKRNLISLITILFAAILLTNINFGFLNLDFLNLSIGSDIFNNMSTLREPSSAGSSRFLIWENAWLMIQEAPWFGHGAGTFSLLYPQYRIASDISGGLFVHNDYLQIWLEMGLPALLLLLALLIATTHTFIKYWRAEKYLNLQLEAIGLFCGLSSVAIHSIFTFNLYILSMLVISGIFLGRLNQLCTAKQTAFIHLDIQPSLLRIIIIITSSIILLSFTSTWAHKYYYQQAISEHKQKKFDLANKSFTLSSKFHTTYTSRVSHANLLSDSIETWPENNIEKRKILYNKALEFLDEAKILNPLRTSQYNIRAHLYSSYPEFSGENSLMLAQQAYQHSLDLNPRLFKVRYLLAKLFISENNTAKALEILTPGLIKPIFPWEKPIPYLHLTMSALLTVGNTDEATKIAKTIRKWQKSDARLSIEAILKTGRL